MPGHLHNNFRFATLVSGTIVAGFYVPTLNHVFANPGDN